MKLNKELASVLADMEYLIGKECYNPNSYDGWNDIEGCGFRYPVTLRFPVKDRFIKFRGNINDKLIIYEDEDDLLEALTFMKYKFGSNELFIGKGLQNVLNYLEDRYGLDFAELERNKECGHKLNGG